jgi:hypothetical protein
MRPKSGRVGEGVKGEKVIDIIFVIYCVGIFVKYL